MKADGGEVKLCERIAKGDQRAFTQLFAKYHQRIGRFVRVLTSDKDITEQVVQDVFVKLWKGRTQLPAIRDFPGYLFILTRNQTLNALRQMTKEIRQRQVYEKYVENLLPGYDFPDNQETEYASLVSKAVSRLPPQHRRVFTLRMKGFKNPEIAEQLGISTHSVTKYHQLALRSVSEFVKVHSRAFLFLFF